MGMQGTPVEAPEIYGLPEFFISNVVTEIDGPNVRMVCGVKRGGRIDWLYSCVMRADQLIGAAKQCEDAATEAFNLQELLAARRH